MYQMLKVDGLGFGLLFPGVVYAAWGCTAVGYMSVDYTADYAIADDMTVDNKAAGYAADAVELGN